jgi:ATP-dependent Clp protease ATP-binding subunit ClpC
MSGEMFGTAVALVQVDMSEYIEKFAVSRMIGAPPGYVGHEDGGQLTETIRRKRYAVILCNEVEKAHPDVSQVLLQIMGYGYLTESVGHRADFDNTILLMTSNVGAEMLRKNVTVRFSSGISDGFERAKEKILEEAKQTLKSERVNLEFRRFKCQYP